MYHTTACTQVGRAFCSGCHLGRLESWHRLQEVSADPLCALSIMVHCMSTDDGQRCSNAWLLPAADAIFPKQQAQTALPPVSPVPGRTKRHKQGLKHTLLTAAPACTLEIPKQKSEEEVWNAIRCEPLPWSSTSDGVTHVHTVLSVIRRSTGQYGFCMTKPCPI